MLLWQSDWTFRFGIAAFFRFAQRWCVLNSYPEHSSIQLVSVYPHTCAEGLWCVVRGLRRGGTCEEGRKRNQEVKSPGAHHLEMSQGQLLSTHSCAPGGSTPSRGRCGGFYNTRDTGKNGSTMKDAEVERVDCSGSEEIMRQLCKWRRWTTFSISTV